MKKSRAIILLIATVVVIVGYVAWATWEPAPTIQLLTFSKEVSADARSAAEAHFRSHPPEVQRLTWQLLLQRLANPYRPRETPSIPVSIIHYEGERELLHIAYPEELFFLERSGEDGTWSRAHLSYD